MAYAITRLLLVLGASTLARLDTIPFDGRVLLFAIGLLITIGLLIGTAPAWRLASGDLRGLLNAGGRTATATRSTSQIMSGLIVVEVALAIAVVAGASWLVQSFAALRTIHPGFIADGRMVVDVRATRTFTEREAGVAWGDALIAQVRAATGGAIGAGLTFPLRADQEGALNVELQSEPHDPTRFRGGHVRTVSPGYFEAMGTSLVTGRTFTDDDRRGGEPVVIVNRAFVQQFFPNSDPLANALAYGFPTVDRKTMSRVVGVVDDIRYVSLAKPGEPTFYLPAAQSAFPLLRQSFVAAVGNDGPATVARIREALRRFDPQAMVTITPASDIVAGSLVREGLGMTLMLLFGVTALVLAAVGIYGVVAYAGAQRSPELATRLALGATPQHVFWLMMRSGQILAFVGLPIGLAAAYAGGRMIAASVYGMRAADPLVLAAAGAVVMLVTAAAIFIPSIAASRLPAARALR